MSALIAKTENDAEQTEAQADENTFKVGVIFNGDPDAQGTVAYSHGLGITAMQNSIGLSDGQLVRVANVPENDAEAVKAAVERCAGEGCKIIFAAADGYSSAVKSAAKEYPDIYFSVAFGNVNNGSNLNCYSGKIYQSFYLAGIAAGNRTESGLIGFVSVLDGGNTDCVNAFAMGVESVRPEARVYALFTDSGGEYSAAERLINMGCDVLAQHSESAAPQLLAQSSGTWCCGYNSEGDEAAPDSILVSPVWNWGIYYTMAAKNVMDGKWENKDYLGGMGDGFISLSAVTRNCASGTKDAIEEAKAKILSGDEIFFGEIVDNEGNVVCSGEQSLDPSDMTWLYRNVEKVN